jgi:hydroxyacylglutathione hydrolase
MNILTFALGQLQANCYFLIKGKDCLVIDPADSADFILEEVQRRNLNLVGMIATHGHFDHVMAVGEIQLSFPSLPLHIHKKDTFLIDRLEKTAAYFLGYEPVIIKPKLLNYLSEGDMTIGAFSFSILYLPGHTPGCVGFYFPEENTIFSGDTLFKGAIGRYDFSYSDATLLKKSLKKLITLPESTIIYSGHGEVTTVADEKLQDWSFL